jgi:hypothetical protein
MLITDRSIVFASVVVPRWNLLFRSFGFVILLPRRIIRKLVLLELFGPLLSHSDSFRLLRLFDDSLTSGQVNQVLHVSDVFIAFFTLLGPGFAYFDMGSVISYWNVLLAVLTELGFFGTRILVLFHIITVELFFAVQAFLPFVKLLSMFLLVVNVVHLPTFPTLFDVPPAVAKMCGHLGFRKNLEAIIALLGRLAHGRYL